MLRNNLNLLESECSGVFTHSVRQAAAADSQSVGTSLQGRDLETHSPPTDRTHPPSHQNEYAGVCVQSWSLWRHTPDVAPSDPLPPASSLYGNRDSVHPESKRGHDSMACTTMHNSRQNTMHYLKQTKLKQKNIIPPSLRMKTYFVKELHRGCN